MLDDMQATITRLKELDQQASPAPWIVDIDGEILGAPTIHKDGMPLREALNIATPYCESIEDSEDSNLDCNAILLVELRNTAPALIADYERKTRKLAIYEKRMAYIAAHYPAVYAEVLKQAPEQEI